MSELAATAPADCALVLGLPLDRRGFHRGLSRPDQDFARFVKGRGNRSDEGAWNAFEGVAAATLRSCSRAERYGVTVYRDAGMKELGEGFRSKAVVSLVTHLRLTALGEADVFAPEILARRLLEHDHVLAAALRRELRRSLGAPPWSHREMVDALAELTARAHRALREEHPFSRGGIPHQDVPVEHFNRLTMERLFPDAVREAGAIELRDGLHTLTAFLDAMPVSWDGILDLTLCDSQALAPWIKADRPRGMVVAGRGSAFLDVRMARYLVLVRSLHRRPRPFLEMVGRVHSAPSEGSPPMLMKVRTVLSRYGEIEATPLGGEGRTLSDRERRALRRDLERIERNNGRLVWIGVVLLVALFTAWLVVVFQSDLDPDRVQVASAAFGLSAAGCIATLFRVWRERSSAALLLRLAIDLGGEALTAVIDVLAARARSGSRTRAPHEPPS